MKKYLFAFSIVALVLLPSWGLAISVGWDRYIVGGLRTLYSGDRVLIGTTSTTTSATAEVNGNLAVVGNTATSSFSGGLYATLVSAPYFHATSTSATSTIAGGLNIENGGFVGIGTSSPIAKLTLEGGDFFHRASTSPTITGFVSDATNFNTPRGGIKVVGNYVYATEVGSEILAIFDVSSSTAPQVISSLSVVVADPIGIDVQGNYAYIAAPTGDSLVIVDISNPKTPKIVSTLTSNTQLDGAHNVAVQGRYAYVTALIDDMFTIVDVSNPTAPRVVSTITSASLLDSAYSVMVRGKYAYVTASNSSSFVVIDISRPDAPVIVGSLTDATNLNNAKNISLSAGRYAYTVATTTSTFTAIDISNPESPTIAGTLTDTTKLAQIASVVADVAIQCAGNYCYVGGDSNDYLNVIDVSNPARPYFVTSDTSATRFDGITGLAVAGNRLYSVARIDSMLTVVDLNGTETPSLATGALRTGLLDVTGPANFMGRVNIGGGLNVGLGGIYSNGGIFSYVASSTASPAIAGAFVGGNVGIGTSSPFGLFSIEQGTETNSLWVANTGSSTPSLVVLGVNGNGNVGIATTSPWRALSIAGTGAWTGLTTESGAGNVLCVKTDGEIVQDDSPLTACSGASTVKIKKDIKELDGKEELANLMRYTPIEYRYKESYSKDQSLHLGFTAEEVAEIDPRLAEYQNGEPSGVKYAEFVPKLIAAIQEQQKEIDTLREALESAGIQVQEESFWQKLMDLFN
jgi:hypothetical protein